MKVALVIGHKPSSPGAKNEKLDMTEFEFNSNLADDISKELSTAGIEHEIVFRDTYKDLPDKINSVEPDCIVSLHCNAYDTRATGTEVLYYHASEKSKDMAEVFQKHMVEALKIRNRGTLERHSEDRGGYLLRYTNAPCIISEPFFIDNDSDCKVVLDHYDDFVGAHVLGIKEVLSFMA